jgi:tetratricopeptide (TPR) repeat protein
MKHACQHTHGLLSAGRCPWCDCPIVDGQPKPDLPPREAAFRRWNVSALMKALDHEEADVRIMAVSNLLLHGSKVEVLPVLRKALKNLHEDVRRMVVHALLHRRGSQLAPDDVEKFERELVKQPDDCALRLLLAGYYFRSHRMYDSARQARHGHILWIIKHAPEVTTLADPFFYLDPTSDGQVYELAKKLWLRQVQTNEGNATILGNAAKFFTLHDKELSEELLKKAQLLEPNNPEWAQQLGHLYHLEAHRSKGEPRPQAAMQAFVELERAFHLENDQRKRVGMMPDLAKTAFATGKFDEARSYATDLSAKVAQPDYSDSKNGDAIHHGNLVLGRLALKLGDVEKAKEHLLKAGQISGGAGLCSFGPNMMLAKELLELGDREVVIQYLKLCQFLAHSRPSRREVDLRNRTRSDSQFWRQPCLLRSTREKGGAYWRTRLATRN